MFQSMDLRCGLSVIFLMLGLEVRELRVDVPLVIGSVLKLCFGVEVLLVGVLLEGLVLVAEGVEVFGEGLDLESGRMEFGLCLLELLF